MNFFLLLCLLILFPYTCNSVFSCNYLCKVPCYKDRPSGSQQLRLLKRGDLILKWVFQEQGVMRLTKITLLGQNTSFASSKEHKSLYVLLERVSRESYTFFGICSQFGIISERTVKKFFFAQRY